MTHAVALRWPSRFEKGVIGSFGWWSTAIRHSGHRPIKTCRYQFRRTYIAGASSKTTQSLSQAFFCGVFPTLPSDNNPRHQPNRHYPLTSWACQPSRAPCATFAQPTTPSLHYAFQPHNKASSPFWCPHIRQSCQQGARCRWELPT